MNYKLLFLLILNISIHAQSFKVKTEDSQKFIFGNKISGNQIVFSSSTPLEDFTGTASAVNGYVTFLNSNFAKTIKSKFSVSVKSINTGIELRNRHLQSSNWLNAEKYPEILFELLSVNGVKQQSDNKLSFNAVGNFTLHGVTKQIQIEADAIYLAESDQTKLRGPGDLLGISAAFNINLSDYNIDNSLVGNKVAEKIAVKVTVVGSNKME